MGGGKGKRTRSAPGPERRRAEVADAALRVLAAAGSRGLTHRAVDEEAGLPAGSTSNCFRSREALLEGAARRHAELDNPPDAALEDITEPAATVTHEQAVALVMAALDRVLAPEARPMLAARYELILESIRRPALHGVMEGSRRHFVFLAELLARSRGCETPDTHGAQLLALMDGITSDQMQDLPTTLDRAGIEESIDRFLRSC